MEKLDFVLNKIEETIMVVGGLIMVVMNFLNVICRYLLPKTPFSYTEELVVLVFMWVSMFGISYAYRRGAHTLLTILSDLIRGKARLAIIAFSTIASLLMMGLLAKTGYGMVMNQIQYNMILPGMRIPMAYMGWSVPLGAAAACFSVLVSGYKESKAILKGQEGK